MRHWKLKDANWNVGELKLEPNKKYKVVDDDLINGYQVLTGKQLNSLLETAYKQVMRSKKWPLTKATTKQN